MQHTRAFDSRPGVKQQTSKAGAWLVAKLLHATKPSQQNTTPPTCFLCRFLAHYIFPNGDYINLLGGTGSGVLYSPSVQVLGSSHVLLETLNICPALHSNSPH